MRARGSVRDERRTRNTANTDEDLGHLKALGQSVLDRDRARVNVLSGPQMVSITTDLIIIDSIFIQPIVSSGLGRRRESGSFAGGCFLKINNYICYELRKDLIVHLIHYNYIKYNVSLYDIKIVV